MKHRVVTYFILAYLFSWAVEIPLALQAQGLVHWSLPWWTHYFAGYGPLASALVVTRRAEGRAGLRDLLARMIRWRIRPLWWLAVFAPVVLCLLTTVVLRMARGWWIDLSLLGRISFLPDLGAGAWLLWVVTFGLGEEAGWRGFALPHLQRRRSAFSATLILAVFWIGWHLPTFFYLPSYTGMDPRVLPMFVLGITAGAIVLTWLYNGTGGSVMAVALAHGSLNFVTAAPAADPAIPAVVSTAVMVWAIVVVVWWKPATLAPGPRQVAGGPLY